MEFRCSSSSSSSSSSPSFGVNDEYGSWCRMGGSNKTHTAMGLGGRRRITGHFTAPKNWINFGQWNVCQRRGVGTDQDGWEHQIDDTSTYLNEWGKIREVIRTVSTVAVALHNRMNSSRTVSKSRFGFRRFESFGKFHWLVGDPTSDHPKFLTTFCHQSTPLVVLGGFENGAIAILEMFFLQRSLPSAVLAEAPVMILDPSLFTFKIEYF